MNSLTDPHDHETRTAAPEREITLGTTLLLGIFFALAALCAAFFGFGYSLGAKHTNVVTVASDPQPTLKLNGAKPAAGLAAPATKASAEPAVAPAPPPEKLAAEITTVDSTLAEPPPSRAHPTAEAAPAPPAVIPAPPSGPMQFLVQIAAVTHQEDADLIASTLTRRGYAVNIRPEPQDKLLHVQVGPFPTKKDAEAMRQRLMADGFNAYIK